MSGLQCTRFPTLKSHDLRREKYKRIQRVYREFPRIKLIRSPLCMHTGTITDRIFWKSMMKNAFLDGDNFLLINLISDRYFSCNSGGFVCFVLG